METYKPEDPNTELLNELDLAIEGQLLSDIDPIGAEEKAQKLIRQREAVHGFDRGKINEFEAAIQKNHEGISRLESIKERMSGMSIVSPELEAKYDAALAKITQDLEDNEKALNHSIQDVDKEDSKAREAMKNPHVAQAMYGEALKEDEERSKE